MLNMNSQSYRYWTLSLRRGHGEVIFSNFVIVNNAPAWINFDEVLKAPHPPALLLKEKGATSFLKC
jgi:hypothetical protein